MSIPRIDANNAIRSVYDATSNTLKVSIPSLTTEIELSADDGDSVLSQPRAVDNTTLVNAVSAAAAFNSDGVDILNYKGYALAVYWTGLDAADATISLQISLDDVNYFTVSGSSVTLTSTPGTHIYNISDAYYKYFRLVYTENTVNAGTITAEYVLKG